MLRQHYRVFKLPVPAPGEPRRATPASYGIALSETFSDEAPRIGTDRKRDRGAHLSNLRRIDIDHHLRGAPGESFVGIGGQHQIKPSADGHEHISVLKGEVRPTGCDAPRSPNEEWVIIRNQIDTKPR